jgi:hypothetical protein
MFECRVQHCSSKLRVSLSYIIIQVTRPLVAPDSFMLIVVFPYYLKCYTLLSTAAPSKKQPTAD